MATKDLTRDLPDDPLSDGDMEVQLQISEKNRDKESALMNTSLTSPLLDKTPVRNLGTTLTQTTFNLVKNIVGAGVLSLPCGVAAGTGLVPAVVITVALGLYSGWTFSKLGEMCERNNVMTFTELGEKVHGKGFAKLMALTCTIKTFFSCFVFSLVICDSWQQILLGFGFSLSRDQVLVGMTSLVLLPLCLMEDLSWLAYTSLLGSGGMIFTVCFMALRLYDGSYLPGGQFYDAVAEHLRPNFEGAPGLFTVDTHTLTLVCLLSTAFIAHYNAPKFYEQLADRSPARFSKVSQVSFNIAILFFLGFMVIGYMTFGVNSQGLILNNYSPIDPLATSARTAIGTAIVFSYPLAFTGLREGTKGLIGNVPKVLLTVGLLTFITGLALVLTDIAFVNAFQGAILGSALIYCFPGMVLIYYAKKTQAPEEVGRSIVCFARFTVVLGIVLGVAGATLAVVNEVNLLSSSK